HQQRGSRQVEIGDQPVDEPERMTGVNKESGFSTERFDRAVRGDTERLQRSRSRRTNGNDATTFAACACQRGRGLLRDGEPFGIDLMILNAVDAHRFERAVADMEGEFGTFNTS